MFIRDLLGRKLYSFAKLTSITLASATLLVACGGGGGGGSKTTSVAVTLSGKVYDQEISGATVEILIGNTVVGTTTSDGSGQYSFDLNVTQAQRTQRCVVRARRGNFSLQSLLGTVGTVADSRNEDNDVNGDNLPGVNVTNVTTALAAIIKRENGGTLPGDQTTIDNLIDTITGNAALQTEVTQIAAAIRAVVDYGADPAAADATVGDTQELAEALAASATFAADLAAVIGSNTGGVTEGDLIAEIGNDPLLAVQLPDTVTGSDLVGKYYVVGEDTLIFYSDASNMTIADYDTLETGGDTGTWSYDTGTKAITMDFTDPVDGPITVVATILGGTPNAVQINAVVDGVDEGNFVLRRMEPVGTTGSHLTEAHFTGEILVDFEGSNAVRFPATCDGVTTTDGWASGLDGTIPAACDTALGMMVISPNWSAVGAPDGGKIIIGMLSDAWDSNAGAPSQAANFVAWEIDDSTGDTETSYGRGYRPIDSGSNPCFTCPVGTDSHPISLRMDANGATSLRLLNNDYQDDFSPTEIVIYSSTRSTPRDKFNWPQKDIGWNYLIGLSANENSLSSSSGSVVVANLGRHSGSDLRAIFSVNNLTNLGVNSVKTRVQWNMVPLTSNDVSGKTFTFKGLDDPTNAGTVTFNGDGSFTGMVTDANGSANFTWAIIEDTMTSAAHGGGGHIYSTLVLDWTDETNVIYGADMGNGSFIIGVIAKNIAGDIENVSAVLLTPQ